MVAMFMIHRLAAVLILLCLFLPIGTGTLASRDPQAAAQRAGKLAGLLRIPHFVLIVSIITGLAVYWAGGFRITLWLAIVFLLFLAIAALFGIITKALKNVKDLAGRNESFQAGAKKAFVLSLVLDLVILLMVAVKFAPLPF
ncbi:hypothetical protein [Brevibacillus massiliensis]|jgi:hypothetical protein|uniref:hypothetical protein n=1 Tax=Brevibacillus massiliensis TaxID=1118054 RepID=UPI0003110ED3|nr:hypothetical protein [Brevibacillus massiliensis]